LTKGELTLVRKYYNLPVPPSLTLPPTGPSVDVKYGYDIWGNRTGVTTYDTAGQTTGFNTTAPAYQAPGGRTVGTTTVTGYDIPYHALPTKVTPPTPDSGVQLIEQASYDYRMGTMTSVTGPNNQTTFASWFVSADSIVPGAATRTKRG
jgi:hypothetical protein